VRVAREVGSHDTRQGEKAYANKTDYKANSQTAATTPMTNAETFDAGRRAYEAAAAGSTGASAPTAEPQRASHDANAA